MPRLPWAPTPRSVGFPRLDTQRFYLRLLQPADASARWIGWLADPDVMHPLNVNTRRFSLDELRTHIARHDQMKRLLIGIFDRSSDLHIGYYRIDLDPKHRLAAINVIIGDKGYWGRKVVNETRAAILDYLFTKASVAKAMGTPPARNFPSVFNYRAQGWRLEGILKHHRESIHSGRIDQLQFGLTKEDWLALRERPNP
jgi:[ribosomal protein S5]-alanine N-acetyltransferase